MLSVLLVCAITASFQAPADWQIVTIEPAGQREWMEYTDRWPVRVTLKREIKAGEAVQPPEGCRTDAEAMGPAVRLYGSGRSWIQLDGSVQSVRP